MRVHHMDKTAGMDFFIGGEMYSLQNVGKSLHWRDPMQPPS